ncbi:MAG: hypothetical protein AABZ61_12820, partial [Bacteroidota bacterium]
ERLGIVFCATGARLPDGQASAFGGDSVPQRAWDCAQTDSYTFPRHPERNPDALNRDEVEG